jgi:hypothetical protein
MSISDLIVALFTLGTQLAKLFGEDVDELRKQAIAEAEKTHFPSDDSWEKWLDLIKK